MILLQKYRNKKCAKRGHKFKKRKPGGYMTVGHWCKRCGKVINPLLDNK